MTNHQPHFYLLASCIKMMLAACAIVDAKLSALDLLTSRPFLTVVFIGYL